MSEKGQKGVYFYRTKDTEEVFDVISEQDKDHPELLVILKYKETIIESKMIGVSYKVKEAILSQLAKAQKTYKQYRYAYSTQTWKLQQLSKAKFLIQKLLLQLAYLQNNQTIRDSHIKAIRQVQDFKRSYYMQPQEKRQEFISSQWIYCLQQYNQLEKINRSITGYHSSILCAGRDPQLRIQRFSWIQSDLHESLNKKTHIYYSKQEPGYLEGQSPSELKEMLEQEKQEQCHCMSSQQ